MTQEEADNLSTGDLITITHRVRSSNDQCNDGAYNVILMGQLDVPTLSGDWRAYEVYDHRGKIKRVTCEQIVRLVDSY
tara:strand:- start:562 stop:795 length:234 start_codon:yes stop_codon:yes gene_type:complete